MKGCARTGILQLLFLLAAAGGCAALLYYHDSIEPAESWGISLGAGFLAWLGLALIVGIHQPLRERAALRACMRGQRPRDATHTAITGTIDSRERLRAPLSGADCVAFKYEIYRVMAGGKGSHKSTSYEGIALIPSTISTAAGAFRLMAVPTFDFAADTLDPEVARRNAAQHVRTATFSETILSVEKQWTDDDGSYRHETRSPRATGDMSEMLFTEHHVKRGDKVCAFGLYSQQRGGLVPDANWAKEARIMKGDGEAVIRRLTTRVARYLSWGAIFCLCAVAAVMLYLSMR